MTARPRRPCVALAVALNLVGCATAGAAGSEDWSCVQRKVAEISLAAVWTGAPIDAAALRWREDPEIARLVEHLAARRTSEEEARRAIVDLAASSGGARRDKLLALVAGLVETINAERSKVIVGIERFAQGQKRLAAVIRDENARLAAVASGSPDATYEKHRRLLSLQDA